MYIAGMDIGAITIKTVIVNEKGVVGSTIFESGVSPKRSATQSLQAALELAGIEYDKLDLIVTTGHGRNAIPFSSMAKSEISAMAKGAQLVSKDIKVVADVGGQGIRVMRLHDDGSVDKFLTNDKCSAGTGGFLDTMAIALGVKLGDLGDLSKMSCSPSCMSTKCTIFAESEVVSLVARGTSKEDIIAGLHQAVAQKVNGLVTGLSRDGKVLFCGGVARNEGVIKEMETVFGERLEVPPYPQLITAMGAAAYGLENMGVVV